MFVVLERPTALEIPAIYVFIFIIILLFQ